LNYYPAVAEAFYSRIPLVVISADRPPYKIDIGDGQTIRQPGVFEKHIGFQAALHQDLTHAPERIREEGARGDPGRGLNERQALRQRQNEELISRALHTAIHSQCPVHLNAPFEEPLYQTTETPAFLPEKVPDPVTAQTATPDWDSLAVIWQQAGKKWS
jgi:2-succinyl-5-enolpyruvyl-6-hydroxy-3-cyclohexene-1-carboxylate synthase